MIITNFMFSTAQ